ncbi:MAG: DUF4340 domain-containing protein [Bacteroidota bacterium]
MNFLKNRNLVLGTLLLIAASLYAAYVYQQGGSSLNDRDIAFAVEDTAAVDRMVLTRFLQEEEQEELQFSRTESGWLLNERYPAFQPNVNSLLGTLSQLHVQEVLIEKGLDAGKELLEQQRLRLEVYDGRKKVKEILIGREGKDAQGTLMMLASSSRPFIVGIPGFSGYLNSRFTMDMDFWREKLLFSAKEEELQLINITYKKDSLQDVILGKQDGNWVLNSGKGDPQKIAEYLSQFQGKVYAEAFVRRSYPEIMKRAERFDADISLCIIFNTPSQPDQDISSPPSTCVYLYEQEDDPNTYLGCIQYDQELMSIQHFVFDKYLVKREELQ